MFFLFSSPFQSFFLCGSTVAHRWMTGQKKRTVKIKGLFWEFCGLEGVASIYMARKHGWEKLIQASVRWLRSRMGSWRSEDIGAQKELNQCSPGICR